MLHTKNKKARSKAILALVRKEMARPRMTESAAIAERVLKASSIRRNRNLTAEKFHGISK